MIPIIKESLIGITQIIQDIQLYKRAPSHNQGRIALVLQYRRVAIPPCKGRCAFLQVFDVTFTTRRKKLRSKNLFNQFFSFLTNGKHQDPLFVRNCCKRHQIIDLDLWVQVRGESTCKWLEFGIFPPWLQESLLFCCIDGLDYHRLWNCIQEDFAVCVHWDEQPCAQVLCLFRFVTFLSVWGVFEYFRRLSPVVVCYVGNNIDVFIFRPKPITFGFSELHLRLGPFTERQVDDRWPFMMIFDRLQWLRRIRHIKQHNLSELVTN